MQSFLLRSTQRRRRCTRGSCEADPSSSEEAAVDAEEYAGLGEWRACLSTPRETHNQRTTDANILNCATPQSTASKHPELCATHYTNRHETKHRKRNFAPVFICITHPELCDKKTLTCTCCQDPSVPASSETTKTEKKNREKKLLDSHEEKLLDKQNSSNQPKQTQIQFVTDRGRLDDMQDGRNTTRSQEIIVDSFHEELSSSNRTERPVVSEDMMSLNVEQTHDRTERPVAILHTAAAQDDCQVCHEADTLNVDDELLRKRMERSIAVHDENHELDRERSRHGLPNSRTTTFRCEKRAENHRSTIDSENRTTQIDMLFNATYNKVNHLILSVQSQNK